jgi:hypothetical protein
LVIGCFSGYVPDRIRRALRAVVRLELPDLRVATTYRNHPGDFRGRGDVAVYVMKVEDATPDSKLAELLSAFNGTPFLVYSWPRKPAIYRVEGREGGRAELVLVNDVW